MKKMERMPSGIPGLDNLIEGGFPIPSTTLVAGEPGTGKTTFAVQFLFNGAKNGEIGLYITAISEPNWVVQKFLSEFTFYDQDLIDNETVVFVDIGETLTENPGSMLDEIKETIEQHRPRRIVMDPITVIESALEKRWIARKFLHEFLAFTKAFNAVTLITGEFTYDSIVTSLTSYMADGVIMLSNPEEDGVRRKHLEVIKMRGTKHMTGEQAADITEEGYTIVGGMG